MIRYDQNAPGLLCATQRHYNVTYHPINFIKKMRYTVKKWVHLMILTPKPHTNQTDVSIAIAFVTFIFSFFLGNYATLKSVRKYFVRSGLNKQNRLLIPWDSFLCLLHNAITVLLCL
jgi:hypothetical protein